MVNRAPKGTVATPAGRDPFSWFVAPAVIGIAAFLVISAGVYDGGFGKRWIGAGDTWAYAGPVLYFMDYAIHQGELPLWNPLVNCGQPFAANPQSFLFYPVNLVRSLITVSPTPFKTHVGVAVMVLLHLWIGGLGAFALARRHNLSQGAALVAAFVFMLSAPATSRAIGHWYFHFALAWAPWLLYCAQAALTGRSKSAVRRAVLVAGLLYGLILLAGTPHFMVLTGFLLACYWFIWRIADFAAAKPKNWGELASTVFADVFRLAAIAVIGALVAAPLLLPAFEFSQFSARAASELGVEHLERSGPPWNVWQRLAIYSGDATYEGLRASGALALIFAITALASIRRREVGVYAALFLIALDCSLDKPFLFGHIFTAVSPYPVSSPPRGMLLACLPLGMLAALGVDALTESESTRRRRIAISIAAIAAALAVLATVWQAAVPHPYLAIGLVTIVIPAFAALAAVALRWQPIPFFGSIFVAMLVLGEILFWNRAMLPYWLNDDLLYPKPVETLQGEREFWTTNRRGTDKQPNLNMYRLDPAINGYDPLHLQAIADIMGYGDPKANFRRVFFFDEPTAHSYHGLSFMKRQFWLTRQYVDGPLPSRDEVFPPTTTVFIDHPGILPVNRVDAVHHVGKAVSSQVKKHPLIAQGAAPLVLEAAGDGEKQKALTIGPLKLPQAHAALALTVESTALAKLNPMCLEPDTAQNELGKILPLIPTNPGQGIYHEVPLPDYARLEMAITADFNESKGRLRFADMQILEDTADEDALIELVERTPNAVRLRLRELPAPRILLNVDAWYPGWSAYVDGRKVPLIKANDAFKAIAVPPGTHEVAFVFRAPKVTAGLILSALTLLVVAGYLLRPRFRRRA